MRLNATLNPRIAKQLYITPLPLLIAILTSITILTGTILSSNTVSADDNTSVVDQINITVPVSCTISGTGMNTHNANINNGLYEDDIGSTTLHAFCNDNEGFAIYAAGYTGNEVGGTNSNKLVGTNASNNATIESGIATTSGNPDVSNWAMKLAITQDSGDITGTNAFTIDSAPNVSLPSQAEQSATSTPFSQYHVVPNEYTKVAHKNSATDMTDTTGGVKLTTTYAAYISKTQAADTYSGQVIYTLVHPASADAPIFLNPNADDISEVTYMQQFAVVSDANRQAIIDSMVLEQQYTLIDSRDGKTYTIAKFPSVQDSQSDEAYLADDYIDTCHGGDCDEALYEQLPSKWRLFVDSCDATMLGLEGCDMSLYPMLYNVWMTKNLDLDLDTSRTYTNEDTDIGYNYETGEYESASWTPNSSTVIDVNNWSSSNSMPASFDLGDYYYVDLASDPQIQIVEDYLNGCERGACDPALYAELSSEWKTFVDSCDFESHECDNSLIPNLMNSSGIPQYHVGNIYNWTAAVAMNDSSVISTSGTVEQSICPAGWGLPRAGSGQDSFYVLRSIYGNSNLSTEPVFYAPAGMISNGVVYPSSFLWSSNYYDSNKAYRDSDESFAPEMFYRVSRSDGYIVRCIARPLRHDVFMNSGISH